MYVLVLVIIMIIIIFGLLVHLQLIRLTIYTLCYMMGTCTQRAATRGAPMHSIPMKVEARRQDIGIISGKYAYVFPLPWLDSTS